MWDRRAEEKLGQSTEKKRGEKDMGKSPFWSENRKMERQNGALIFDEGGEDTQEETRGSSSNIADGRGGGGGK